MRKTTRAVLAGLVSSFASLAAAVYPSPSGFGQALIYPYYSVQAVDGNVFNTYVTIANGHSTAKALRVRLREGRNGREVAGFNLFLNGYGMWAGAIGPTANGVALVSGDPACTAPAFTDGALALSTAGFTGANADGLGLGADRLREGYIEVLEMATFTTTMPTCESLRGNLAAAPNGAPQGYLYGTLTLINVANGMDFTVNASALGGLATGAYYRPANDPYPDFTANEIGKVAAFQRNDKMYRMTMPTSVSAVEAALLIGRFSNELVLDAGTASATDWVVTLPTRRFHTSVATSPWFNAAGPPVRLKGRLSTRSGGGTLLVSECVGVCQGGAAFVQIDMPWAANVLGFSALGGNFATGAAGITDALGSQNGWKVGLPMAPGGASLELQFLGNASNAYPSVTLFATSTRLGDGAVLNEEIKLTGLPMVGFMARSLRNGTLACSSGSCQGNYGGASPHRVRRVVDPANDP